MGEHIISGCIVKYDTPWYNGTVIDKGAFESISKVEKVPIFNNLRDREVVGRCDLDYRAEGVYGTCYMNDCAETEDIVSLIKKEHMQFGLYANKIKRLDNRITAGVIRAIAIISFLDNSSSIFAIDGLPVRSWKTTRLNVRHLKEEMFRNDLSQRDLADKIGISEVSISRYVSQQRMPRAGILAKMAEVLGTTPEYLTHKESQDNDLDIWFNKTRAAICMYRGGWTEKQKKMLIMELLKDSEMEE